jgi:SNF2 family DNA or RNA helicase
MIIKFSRDRSHVIFQYENSKENAELSKFPGFVKYELQNAAPANLPVVYNLVQRGLKVWKNVKIETSLKTWLGQPLKLKSLPEEFKFITTPKDFQEIALRFLYTLGSAGILLDPGMGKTKVILDYIVLMKFKLSFVVCPAALLFVWEDEIRIHRSDLKCYVIRSTDWEAELPEILAADVVIVNYSKTVILKHRIKELNIDFIHLDEFLIKDNSTSRTKSILEISKSIPFRAGGSGTLINNTPLDAFSPIRYLQPSLVGWNYSNFMERYCVMKDFEASPGQAKSRRPVAFKNQVEIKSILESCCIVMTKDQWLKLPEKRFHDIYVQMAPDQKDAYYSLMKNYFVNIQGRDIEVDNPLVMLAKLYQISQGFVYYSEPVEGHPSPSSEEIDELLALEIKSKTKKNKRETLYFSETPKVVALEKLLTETLVGKKAIIWYNLSGEYKLIKDLLDKLGHRYLSIQGGDKKIGDKVRQFNKTPEISWLVCQAKSVNYGITVMGSKVEDLEKEGVEVLPTLDPSVHTEIFFSLNFSLEIYSQQQDRIHRLGQDKVCDYYRIFSNNPVESKIRQALADKMSIRLEMLVDVSKTLLTEIFEISTT